MCFSRRRSPSRAPAFTDGGNIPSKFTCDAGQTSPSPALTWKDAPAGTKSFALVMDDPDVTQIPGGFVHWVLLDIPAKTKELPEGFQVGSLGVSGNTGMRRPGYMGPCPPTGAHHYHFKLYALDVETLGLAAGREPRGRREGAGRTQAARNGRDDRDLSETAEVNRVSNLKSELSLKRRSVSAGRRLLWSDKARHASLATPIARRTIIDCIRFIPVRA